MKRIAALLAILIASPSLAQTVTNLPPTAGTAQRVVTKTATTLNTNTTVCPVPPASQQPVSVEISSTVAAVGIGLNGQTLTAATVGAGATTPDVILPAPPALYTPPIPPTNIITAYGPAATVVCIQTLR